jgi:hypothetical protein
MKRIGLVAVLTLAVGALAASSARASTVTVGSPLIGVFTNTDSCGPPSCTWASSQLAAAGANAASPVTGVIVRWRMTGSYSGGPFELRVLRPASGGAYTGAGTSGPVTPPGGTQTFAANLPIEAGDLIGLDEPTGSHIGAYGVLGDVALAFGPPALADGSTASPSLVSGNNEPGFNADVQPEPGINLIGPTSGSVSGGTKVVIAGHDLGGASAVHFGAATVGFTVDSDSKITATAPASTSIGPVDVGVTTVGGTTPAVAADKFTFTGCVVPKLKGRLGKAKKVLGRNDCHLGKVKGPRGGTVKKQSPKPGTVLPPDSKVTVKLG